MPIPVSFAILIAALAGIISVFKSHESDRVFVREVLVARELVKVCDSGQPTDRDCARVRQVALYGPDVPEEEMGWIKACDAREKALGARASQAFLERCAKARTRVMELSGKAASVRSEAG